MATVTTHEVDTKKDKNAENVRTNLTLDWEGMTEDDVRALAAQALIVKLQSGWRKNGIPNGDATVKAVEHKVGVRAPRKPVDVKNLIASADEATRAELLEYIRSLSKE